MSVAKILREGIDFKFGRHIRSRRTHIDIENNQNRSKDKPIVPHKLRIPLLVKTHKRLGFPHKQRKINLEKCERIFLG